LKVLANSFITYTKTSARSNEKLKILHGAIAKDLADFLGPGYKIDSLGYKIGKEKIIEGRYMDKVVDISISNASRTLAGIGVKFVMSNYSQNSNNYFENMLGETANIRSGGKAYFQIIIIPVVLPYFDKDHRITKWERITRNNLSKYLVLSSDVVSDYMHTPIKSLIYLVNIPGNGNNEIKNLDEYKKFYSSLNGNLILSCEPPDDDFGNNVIFNDYQQFTSKLIHYIKSI